MGLLIFWGIIFVIVMLHELGHLLVAKKFGVRVKTYSIGFGPRLIGVKICKGKIAIRFGILKPTHPEIWSREDITEYRLAPIPFGGFCDMEGELESSGKDYELASRPFRQKLAIALAGVGANIITGFLALVGISIKNHGLVRGIIRAGLLVYKAVIAMFQGIYFLCTNQIGITTAQEVNIIMAGINIEYIIVYFGLFSIAMAIINAFPFWPCLDGSLPILWSFEKFLGKDKGQKLASILSIIGFLTLMLLQIIILYYWIFG